jgi:CubicO group peptidase (beta-lactamase class C family)
LDYVPENRINLHSLLIAHRDQTILEVYLHPYHPNSHVDVRSVAKGITALVVGIALHEGYFVNIDQIALSFFPERTVQHRDVRKESITIRHLLAMSSGMALTDADSGRFLTEPDAFQWMLDAPMDAEPGATFVYSSSNFYWLSAILQRATGKTLGEYAQATLFDPLGIKQVRWQTSLQGITYGWGGLWLTTQDLAKLGQLVLSRGLWNGVQIVPSEWIDQVTQIQPPGTNYGFGWWLDHGGVLMSGYGGQFVYLRPEQNLVVVMTSGLRDPQPVFYHLLDSFILPSLNQMPEHDLQARIAALAQPRPQPTPDLPDVAHRISGQCWALTPNGLGLTAFALTFQDDTAIILLESGEDRAELPLGLDGVLRGVLVERLGPLGAQDRMAATGVWQDEQTLTMRWYSVNNPEYWDVTCVFEGDHLQWTWEDGITGYSETKIISMMRTNLGASND